MCRLGCVAELVLIMDIWDLTKKKENLTCMHLLAEVSLKEKEVELNLVIHELRKNFSSVQVQLAKEQAEKLVRNV